MKSRLFYSLLETVGLIALLLTIGWVFGVEDRWQEAALNPFWIVVLLVTVQYGTTEGLLACLLCTTALYLGNVPLQGMEESSFEYSWRLLYLPFMWFLSAFILGEIRMRSFYENKELSKEVQILRERIKLIADGYEKMKVNKEVLETKIASEVTTLQGTYQILKRLEHQNPAKILYSLEELIEKTFNPQKFSVWAHGVHGLEAVLSKGWESTDLYTRRIAQDHPLAKAVLGEKKTLSITNRDDEKALAGQGILAAPLVNEETGQIFGMIKIEKIPFQSINLSNIEIFRTLAALVGAAFSNAEQFKAFKESVIFCPHTKEFSFASMRMFFMLMQRFDIPSTVIELKSSNLSLSEQEKISLEVLKIIKGSVPKIAIIGMEDLIKVNFMILLPNLDAKGAEKASLELLEKLTGAYPKVTFNISSKNLETEAAWKV